jgi:hypothetical protein
VAGLVVGIGSFAAVMKSRLRLCGRGRQDMHSIRYGKKNASSLVSAADRCVVAATLLDSKCYYAGDRLCGLVVRVLGYRSGGPGSIHGTTRKKN